MDLKFLFVKYMLVFYSSNILLAGILLLWADPAFSQAPKFRHLTINDGISQNTINCIYQDHDGFMWFGTQDGLNRYDGYEYNILRHDPSDSNSLSHSWIWDVFEDSQLNLWIATWHGLTRYNPMENSYYRYFPEPGSPTRIQGGRPTAVCEDIYGFIWVATWGGGLSRFNPRSGHFTTYRHDPAEPGSIPGDLVRTLFYDRNNTLWVGTWSGLASCRPDTSSQVSFTIYQKKDPPSISSDQITAIHMDSQGILWVGTLGGGLHSKMNDSNRFEVHRFDPADPGSISSNEISAIYETSNGELWVGTASSGLNILNRENHSFDRYTHNPDLEYSLGSNNIFSIYEDASGLIYVGAGGINIYNPQLENFRHITYETGHTGGLSDKSIVAFYEDPKGIIWIGTGAGGLNRYDPVHNEFRIYRHQSTDPLSLGHNSVSSITADSEGYLWIGTRGGGLNRLDPETGIFQHYGTSGENTGTPDLVYINGLLADDNDQLWIATYDNGLIHFDPSENNYTHFKSTPGDSTTLSGDYLLRIFQDSRNNIWIGTWGAGLSLYEPEKNRFTRFLHDPSDPKSICDNMVHVIYETTSDSGRTLWCGTSGGLSYFDPDDPSGAHFQHIYQSDGLPSNVIYGILGDASGYLWISSNKGICRFHPGHRTFRNYDVNDGLQSNEFNAGACLELHDHQFLFGGVNGFNAFYPDQITTSQYQPPVVLTSFKIFNESVEFNRSLNTIEHIDLAYKQNFFSFEFAALDYSKPNKNQYRYKMDGIDPDWVISGTRRFASYTKIPPGEYEFLVTGTNSEGVWSSHVKAVEVHVAAPYWLTWWFQVLVVIAVALLLYTLHRFRLRKLLEVERLRLRIASDLHDDVGSALTRIVIHSEQIQSNPDPEKTASNLSKISGISREVITTMSDIIWSIDSRHDTLGNMIDRMTDLAYNTLSLKDIKFSFTYDGLDKSKKMAVDYRQNIYYIFKEAIHNIVKHANASEVRIRLFNDKNTFTMQISDDGKGYRETRGHQGHGLKNMRMRAERIEGQLEITSGKGVTIVLKTPRL